jgi:hypothetical protein
MTLKLNSSSAQISQKKVAAKEIVDQILDENLEYLMNEYMIPEVKGAARAASVPQKFVDGIKFVRTGNNEGNVVNTWGSKELPLALWFNHGTKDHGSLGTWPLHWKDSAGKDIFAMYVRGVPRTEAMEIGMMLGKKRLIQEVPSFVEAHLE